MITRITFFPLLLHVIYIMYCWAYSNGFSIVQLTIPYTLVKRLNRLLQKVCTFSSIDVSFEKREKFESERTSSECFTQSRYECCARRNNSFLSKKNAPTTNSSKSLNKQKETEQRSLREISNFRWILIYK